MTNKMDWEARKKMYRKLADTLYIIMHPEDGCHPPPREEVLA